MNFSKHLFYGAPLDDCFSANETQMANNPIFVCVIGATSIFPEIKFNKENLKAFYSKLQNFRRYMYRGFFLNLSPHVFFESCFHCVKNVRIFPYSLQMQKNTDQKNSKYGDFLRSIHHLLLFLLLELHFSARDVTIKSHHLLVLQF